MVNPPSIRLIICLAHLTWKFLPALAFHPMSVKGQLMFIFNATFLKALYSDLFLYVALLNALSLWFFFFVFSDHWASDTNTPYSYYKVVQFNWTVKIYNQISGGYAGLLEIQAQGYDEPIGIWMCSPSEKLNENKHTLPKRSVFVN
jgi:hypothetical protein